MAAGQASPTLRRIRAVVRGRVQGVGFRAHVEYHARKVGGITGWVRNVGYDTVEAVAEGSRENIERFIEKMKEGPRASRVDEARVEYEETTGMLDGFSVKRSM